MKKAGLITGILLTGLQIMTISGQTGTIEGTVRDKKSSETLIGTTIVIDGTSMGAATDIDGNYTITNVRPGVYNLKVSYISYTPATIEKVKVETGKTTRADISLEEDLVSLGDVTVTGVRRTNTEVSMITDIKASSFVSIGISGQQISRTLDKDASEVVKRVPGITVQDDRFIIVRGLSERYNNVWLNNAATPSSESDVRAFSFDIIPSSMIDNIMIVKSPAAELPADFSGGFVKISTRNMPDKNSTVFSYSTSFNQGTTFQNFYKDGNGQTDFLGFDNGARALPSDMPSHLNEYENATNPEVRNKITGLGREMNTPWLPNQKIAIPEQKFLLGISRKFNIGSHQAGNTTALTYSINDNSDAIQITDYSIYDYVNDKPSYLNQFEDMRYTNSAKVALMHNWSFILGNRTKLEFRNLFNQSGNTRNTVRTGREWYADGRHIYAEEQRYLSRTIYTGQLAGDHKLNEAGTVKADWILGYAYSGKNEPDTRRHKYIRSEQDTTQYLMTFLDNADLSSLSRMWIDLKENTVSAMVNFTFLPVIGGLTAEIKTGLYIESKSRDFNARNFGYAKGSLESEFNLTPLPIDEIFVDENLNLTTGIKLAEMTALSDSYTGANRQASGYVSLRIPFSQRFTLYTGLRVEKNRQILSSYKQGTDIKVDVDRDTLNFFPSANFTFNINEKNLIRLAYGMTVNRPEFREIAPFYYVDFEKNAGVYGAPEIRQSYIQNFDIRYELYPKSGETFSIGLFYKHFKSPIEQVILGNSPTQYSFENVKSAYSTGVEAELRKSLDFLRGFENFTLVLNTSFITSRVNFNPGSLSRNRPLEGQSPFILNAGIYYQNDEKGLMISMLYNVIGKRIVAVGMPSPNQWEDIPDIYEMPRNSLDFMISKMIGKHFEIKGGIKDILNQPVKYVQNVNSSVDMSVYAQGTDTGIKYFDRDQVTKMISPGTTVILGVSLKF